MHAALQRIVATHAGRTALASDGRELCYAQLDARSSSLAARLGAFGVGAGSFVACLLPRSAELVAAQLAVLRCGAAQVPRDPNEPQARLAELVARTDTAAVVCGEDTVEVAAIRPVVVVDCKLDETGG